MRTSFKYGRMAPNIDPASREHFIRRVSSSSSRIRHSLLEETEKLSVEYWSGTLPPSQTKGALRSHIVFYNKINIHSVLWM